MRTRRPDGKHAARVDSDRPDVGQRAAAAERHRPPVRVHGEVTREGTGTLQVQKPGAALANTLARLQFAHAADQIEVRRGVERERRTRE